MIDKRMVPVDKIKDGWTLLQTIGTKLRTAGLYYKLLGNHPFTNGAAVPVFLAINDNTVGYN